jgi:hypothetical protein
MGYYDIYDSNSSFAGCAAGRRHGSFAPGKEMQGAMVIKLIKYAAQKFSTPAHPHSVLFRVSGLHTLPNSQDCFAIRQAIAEPLPWKCREA